MTRDVLSSDGSLANAGGMIYLRGFVGKDLATALIEDRLRCTAEVALLCTKISGKRILIYKCTHTE